MTLEQIILYPLNGRRVTESWFTANANVHAGMARLVAELTAERAFKNAALLNATPLALPAPVKVKRAYLSATPFALPAPVKAKRAYTPRKPKVQS